MYIEDIIQDAAEHEQVSPNDRDLFTSFSKQIHNKKLALTDRQYDLAVLKLIEYRDLFQIDNIATIKTKLPIRVIDRERSVKISSRDTIAVKYVFNKKLINFIETCKKWHKHDDKKSSLHYYRFTDESCFHIINMLQHHQFVIEPDLLERFNQLAEMYNDMESYVPGIYNNKIKNIPAEAIEKMHEQFGEPCDDNMFIYMDRRYDLGLVHFDQDYIEHENKIVEAIVNRKLGSLTAVVRLTKADTTIEELGDALNILKRDNVRVIMGNHFTTEGDIEDCDNFALELSKTFKGTNNLDYYPDGSRGFVNDDSTPIISLNPSNTGIFRKLPLVNLAICYNDEDKPMFSFTKDF